MSRDLLHISRPVVISVEAALADGDESHTTWTVGYAPEPDGAGGRVLIGYLHAHIPGARVDVELASTLLGGPEGNIDANESAVALSTALKSSDAVATLYDIARITAQGLLGTVGAEGALPYECPAPRITHLVRNIGESTEGQQTSLDA